jgi:hypothetical protein
MDFVTCWGCGHIGPQGDTEGLCPLCRGEVDDARARLGISAATMDAPASELREVHLDALGPLFAGGAN